ncbi:hypothetical protein NDU88_005415 [Pleurodeles waltl]|uniref:Uncharacterized protein n=1 Tax=Pleurodeles waltl TaxID=8319 RepID=A0AAV7MW75_PLEWA|nr:hypothetical protein NDU88_005415 [Pleurodeles waltl]
MSVPLSVVLGFGADLEVKEFGGAEGVVQGGFDFEGGFVDDGYASSSFVGAVSARDLYPFEMAMAMSGAEESFHKVSVRKAASGEVESSRSQTSMACLRAERVLRSMQRRWLVLILGGMWALLQVKPQLWQEKGPCALFGKAWRQVVSRLVLSARRVSAL